MSWDSLIRLCMPSSSERMDSADSRIRPVRSPIMVTMGPSSLGGRSSLVAPGMTRLPLFSRIRRCSQFTSGFSMMTCRRLEPMPNTRTPRITPLSTAFAEKASWRRG